MIERVCRGAAIAIALVAAVDPSWVSARAARPTLVLSRQPDVSSAHVERVREALSHDFVITDSEAVAVAARVIVGRHVPTDVPPGRVYLVTPPDRADAVTISGLELADEVPLGAVALVSVMAAVPSGVAGPVEFSLSVDGIQVDRQISPRESVGTAGATLSFVPARTGLTRVRVSARLGSGEPVWVDGATEATNRALRVLFYDARPSWPATFLRRSLEADPRFEVVARMTTSRGIDVSAGAPPPSLAAAGVDTFDVVVIGAPEALSGGDAAALERYLRGREGAVVLLPTEETGSLLPQLTGVPAWAVERRPALDTMSARGLSWTASEFLWPATWPATAEPVTSCLRPARCAVWRLPVGGGRVIVSSALDGWRTRTAASSGYDAFWRAVIADEAVGTPRPLEISLQDRLVQTGSSVAARVLTRSTVPPVAGWESPDGASQAVRLWAAHGRFETEFRAPAIPGRYRLVAQSGDQGASAEFLVVDADDLRLPDSSSPQLRSAFAASRGGQMVSMENLSTFRAQLAQQLPAATEATTTHPLRSPFWIVPFAGLLSVEWWLRRRRGGR